MFAVAYKTYNVGRLCFFVRAKPKLCFGRHWHVLIYSARKTLARLGKQTLFTDIDKKNDSRCQSGKMTDRRLNKKHHLMTTIEHFLMDNSQKLFRDGIEKTIRDIGRYIAATDIFLPTMLNSFYKHWPIIFFMVEEVILFGVAKKFTM